MSKQQFNLQNLLKQAKVMQEKMQQIQNELANKIIESDEKAASGVKIVVNGQGEVLQVKIPKQLVEEGDVELLEDLILMSIRDVFKKVKELQEENLLKLTGGLKLPGLF